MDQNFEIIHKEIFYTLSHLEESSTSLKDKYFKIFYKFIINNTFDDEYIIELINCNFLETIKNHTTDTNIIRQINDISTCCLHVITNVKLRKKCTNCDAKIICTDTCLRCGFEYQEGHSNRGIEEFHKNTYSYPFHQGITIH